MFLDGIIYVIANISKREAVLGQNVLRSSRLTATGKVTNKF